MLRKEKERALGPNTRDVNVLTITWDKLAPCLQHCIHRALCLFSLFCHYNSSTPCNCRILKGAYITGNMTSQINGWPFFQGIIEIHVLLLLILLLLLLLVLLCSMKQNNNWDKKSRVWGILQQMQAPPGQKKGMTSPIKKGEFWKY